MHCTENTANKVVLQPGKSDEGLDPGVSCKWCFKYETTETLSNFKTPFLLTFSFRCCWSIGLFSVFAIATAWFWSLFWTVMAKFHYRRVRPDFVGEPGIRPGAALRHFNGTIVLHSPYCSLSQMHFFSHAQCFVLFFSNKLAAPKLHASVIKEPTTISLSSAIFQKVGFF